MKKILPLVSIMLMTLMAFSQTLQVRELYKLLLNRHFFREIPTELPGTKSPVYPQAVFQQNQVTQPNAITIIDIGHSINAYGFYGGTRTYIWADNDCKSVSFVHRMVNDPLYGGSRIAYDISKDGGATWVNDIQIYEPLGPGGSNPLAAGRYPQGGIYNPSGNTIPGNAFFTYFIPTLDGTNGSTWGGYGYGVHRLDSTLPYTQHNLSTSGAIKQNVPDAFTILPNGSFYAVDPSVDEGIASNYNDSLLISRGTFSPALNDFQVSQNLIYFPSDKYISDTKVAFGPDGLTGYITTLSHHSFIFESDSVFYPVLCKSTDGGVTWGNQIYVKLWGPGGLDGIKNWLTDSAINAFFEPPVPARDEILYTTAWEHDLVVDINGNPHICAVIGIGGGEWNIYIPRDYLAVFDIYSPDGGTTWEARLIDSLKTFKGEFGGSSGITEYNRVQISRTVDGTKLFYSWLDTDMEGITDNTDPNIYCQAIDVTDGKRTKTFNVTSFSPAYAMAYMGSQSHYIFSGSGIYTIPFVYQEMAPTSPGDPVLYKYISNFKMTENDFVGIDELQQEGIIVSDVWPNPAGQYATIQLNLKKQQNCSFKVLNIAGQTILQSQSQSIPAGNTDLRIDVSSLTAGIYMINLTIGSEEVTKKLLKN